MGVKGQGRMWRARDRCGGSGVGVEALQLGMEGLGVKGQGREWRAKDRCGGPEMSMDGFRWVWRAWDGY